MKGTIIALVTLLIAFMTFYNIQTSSHLQKESPFLSYAPECTKELEVECIFDIRKTIQACAKAYETEGADIVADIKCAKDLMADKKHCWPCICAEAKKEHWHVIGC